MQKGFTLIETLVYLALFALMIGGIVVASYNLFETSDRNQTKAMLQEEKNFLVGKIDWALSGAKTVTVTNSPPTLNVTKYDVTSVTISTTMANKDMWLNSSANVLNNSNVTITNLVFTRTYTAPTEPESVEGSFTITARTPEGHIISQFASTTVYVRK